MAKAKKRSLREKQAADQEAARKARHEKRFGPDGQLKRALGKAENALVREAEKKVAKDKKRFTEQGYADLRKQARAEIHKQAFGDPAEGQQEGTA